MSPDVRRFAQSVHASHAGTRTVFLGRSPKPQIGDTTQNLWPEHYVTLTKVLKKIQIKQHYGLIQKKKGALDNEFMNEWLFRFDGK